MIRTNSLSKTFKSRTGTTEAVKDVSVTFPPGLSVLIGGNGSGKSTLIRLLCTIEKPTRGGFSVDGTEIAGRALVNYRRRIGYVPQDVRFASTMTCRDALAYAGWVAGLDRRAYLRRIPEVLEMIELPEIENSRVSNLSGGQTRRVGIAASLIHSPDILFLDEPTAGLDPQARIEVRHLLNRLKDSATIILSTHLQDDLEHVADNVVALHNGRIAYEGEWNRLKAVSADSFSSVSTDPLERALAYVASKH
ncbi:ABC transporter ATP-binding protein [Corynebacterium coyleae]|uniref:ABC transporter ATP-binding protein n=1 Tax=Corynebacterium coyleae TaxID=53374 RepID=UPI0025502483|nr:ABC transporter ATP-binding protein [Corynebacterium coyleae]MDK6492475.1 ABC transporter ATP-binding protein [Corynebacterium coyleae]